jgi:hypothetical protein
VVVPDHVVDPVYFFWGPFLVYSIMAAQFTFPPTEYKGSFFPHPHKHLLLVVLLKIAVLTAVRWNLNVVWLAFLLWPGMLTIFSCTYWDFVLLILRIVYSVHFPIYWLGCRLLGNLVWCCAICHPFSYLLSYSGFIQDVIAYACMFQCFLILSYCSFKSYIKIYVYFELILIQGKRQGSSFRSTSVYSVFTPPFVEDAVFSSAYVLSPFVKTQMDEVAWTYLYIFYSVLMAFVSVFVLVPCCFYCHSSVV